MTTLRECADTAAAALVEMLRSAKGESERRTENADRVTAYSDLTELKESEQRAAAANQPILQSLRYARHIQAAILPQVRDLATVSADHFLWRQWHYNCRYVDSRTRALRRQLCS